MGSARSLPATEALSFENRLAALLDFRRRHGHFDVPLRWKENPGLATWVRSTRGAARKGTLRKSRLQRLKAIGFPFNQLDDRWERRFRELETFKRKNGHCDVPRHLPGGLGIWVSHQRESRREGGLSSARFRRLDRVGFVWEPFGDSFSRRLAELKRFRLRHGHVDVPNHSSGLGIWLSRERVRYRRGRLPDHRRKALESVGVVFDLSQRTWDSCFTELVAFQRATGHCDVPSAWVTRSGRPLGKWVQYQRDRHGAGKLAAVRVRLLSSLGLEWSPRRSKPSDAEALAMLRDFYRKHGHWALPDEPRWRPAAKWLADRVSLYRARQLSPGAERTLLRLNAPLTTAEAKWERAFAAAAAYLRTRRGTRIPSTSRLGRWLLLQRHRLRRGSLTPEQERRVNKLIGAT